ncbi:IS5 family transposase ISOt6 [Orientia tsutsugamushi]|uniref:IS5 family transposase ISOt6 n=1 Tax=Orientia tsutsugamushi TaxID=784 RepID=A0A2R8F213_ORITS|nr:IS5 family transposase ISOt6 [Orientia tsutsugamushi]
MKCDQIKELKDEKFRRLTGVRKGTFAKMMDILRKADGLKK